MLSRIFLVAFWCVENPSDRLTNLKTDPTIASLTDDLTYWGCILNWLLLLISFTNIFTLTVSTLLESIDSLNLVPYISFIYIWTLIISIVATTSPCYWFVTTKFNFWFIGMSVVSMVWNNKIYILISWDGCNIKQSISVNLINHFLILEFW